MTRKWEQHFDLMEDAAIAQHNGACMQAIIESHDAANLSDLYRTIYKYTPCGPWMQVRLRDGRVLGNTVFDEVTDLGEVVGVLLGSIVEGSDAEVEADWLYFDDCDTPEIAAQDFVMTLEWVDGEALEYWTTANWDARVPRGE